MGLTMLLAYTSLEEIQDGRSVLYITPKNPMCQDVTERINLNVFENDDYQSQKTVIRKGQRTHIKAVTIYNIPEDMLSYDTIIFDCPQFMSESKLKPLLEELKKDFTGKLILGNTGFNDFKGAFYHTHRNDDSFEHVNVRRFIHPSFSKEWYDYMIALMGRDKYRLEYECPI
jgi:hypothetical protein